MKINKILPIGILSVAGIILGTTLNTVNHNNTSVKEQDQINILMVKKTAQPEQFYYFDQAEQRSNLPKALFASKKTESFIARYQDGTLARYNVKIALPKYQDKIENISGWENIDYNRITGHLSCLISHPIPVYNEYTDHTEYICLVHNISVNRYDRSFDQQNKYAFFYETTNTIQNQANAETLYNMLVNDAFGLRVDIPNFFLKAEPTQPYPFSIGTVF